jgi:hypothetical protein
MESEVHSTSGSSSIGIRGGHDNLGSGGRRLPLLELAQVSKSIPPAI